MLDIYIYNKLTEEYKKATDFPKTKKRILDQTKSIAAKLAPGYQKQKSKCDHDRWELVARICALWTIHNSEQEQNTVLFIHKPHPGQILAIFLLLQFDQKSISREVKNTMIQVSTGEGKSVILGMLSTYLALVGFNVYEACYSTYLSQRDYNDFGDFFELFEVKDKICYKTFPQICRMILNQNPKKTFVSKVEDLLINPSILDNFNFSSILPKDRKAQSILLIDEVDAFLNQDYIGNSFFPSISIKKGTSKKLLDFVWNQRERASQLTPQQIINSKEFNEFCKEMSNQNFRKLMENQTHAMVRDLNNYKDDSYTLVNGRIFYKFGDSLTDKIHYGYRTIFSYYHEYYISERINSNNLEEQKFINLIIASFSYSKLPSYFSSILGVTGTLNCMSRKQMDILTGRFQVGRNFVQPSIYEDSKRTVNFFKCSENTMSAHILKNIQEENSKNRPVVVFFKTKTEVYHFFNSAQFSNYKSKTYIVTHETEPNERTFRIQMSTSDCNITLLTVDFARGTDFKMRVKNINDHPGLHVICAFLPTSFSDYLQLIGRTGRQGKNGTVKIFILQDSSLSDEQISRAEAQKLISKLDNDHWNSHINTLNQRMQKADKQHDESTALYSSSSNADKIFKKMQIFNKQNLFVKLVSRTVIGIDATMSMGSVFKKLIQVIQTALPKIEAAINDSAVRGTFEIKLVVYRNYNSKADELLAYSNFENKCGNLIDWLKKIEVSGGWLNQALEVCLQHINSLPNANQFVIISDAKGNLPDEVMPKRQQFHGNNYFNSNGFPLTNVKDELAKLKEKKVKAIFYYLNPSSTSTYYNELRSFMGGVAEQFQINHKNNVKIFTDFIANKILTNLGQLVGGNAEEILLKNYKARAT